MSARRSRVEQASRASSRADVVQDRAEEVQPGRIGLARRKEGGVRGLVVAPEIVAVRARDLHAGAAAPAAAPGATQAAGVICGAGAARRARRVAQLGKRAGQPIDRRLPAKARLSMTAAGFAKAGHGARIPLTLIEE